MATRVRIIYAGRVQGVGFRATAAGIARRHAVTGYVRNLPDGTVEAVFEGPAEDVRRLVEWSRRGPRDAVVEDVRVQQEPPEGISGFEVR